jgi:hypothetical protein
MFNFFADYQYGYFLNPTVVLYAPGESKRSKDIGWILDAADYKRSHMMRAVGDILVD